MITHFHPLRPCWFPVAKRAIAPALLAVALQWGSLGLGMLAGWAASSEGEHRFLSNARQLIFEGRRSGEGYFSSEGRWMVFQSERDPNNPFYQIYLLDLTTGESHRVSPGTGKTTCAFLRPGSDDVLFASSHTDADAVGKQKTELDFRASGKQRRYAWDYEEEMDLFVAKRDGTGLRRLTSSRGYDAEASYSPDGQWIVFCSLRSAYEQSPLSADDKKRLETDPAWFGEIYLMKADGSEVRRLTTQPGYDGGPFFSPDGRRIVWRHFEENGTVADIYTMALDGGDVRRLTDFKSMSWAPYFHPSSRYVIFASNKLGFSNFELYLVDAEGRKEPVRVTSQDGFDGLPAFSPDGRRLSWTSNRTPQGASQIHLADWNHEEALRALEASPPRGVTNVAEVVQRRSASEDPTPGAASPGGSVPEITEPELREMVGYLASDALEGRLTGTAGATKASAYLAEALARVGVQPLGGGGGWFHPFEFNAGVTVISNRNSLATLRPDGVGSPHVLGVDFHPLSFTSNGEVEGDVVFAGYGLSVPPGQGPGYDSYAGLDVSNKVVLVLRYVPESVPTPRRQELNRYAGLRYKALIARNRGAKGLLVVTGPTSPNAGELAGFTYDTSQAGSGIVAMTVSGRVAEALFSGSGHSLKELQEGLDTENPHAVGGLALTNARVKVSTGVAHIKKLDRNVIGWIPPGGSQARSLQETELVMVGAHYDHLGLGETGGFARKEEEGRVHTGADDNASGSAALVELAASLAQRRRTEPELFRRGVLFGLWSGEELGLIGSTHFADKPPVPLTNVVAYLNFDMVGRLRENKLTLNGTGSSSHWRRLLERRNVAAGFNLQLLDDPYPPTDVTAFYPKGIPVLAFFTGTHEEYHRPADKPETLNYPGLVRVASFAELLVRDLVSAEQRPDYLKVERSGQGTGSRESLRAYLGTIPDYATEVSGVKLSGARGGSPADKAGIQAGDVIVEFAGQKITNIYDYTYALDAVKIGVPIKLIVLRGGTRTEVTVVPEARK